jgi:hypothetical protein
MLAILALFPWVWVWRGIVLRGHVVVVWRLAGVDGLRRLVVVAVVHLLILGPGLGVVGEMVWFFLVLVQAAFNKSLCDLALCDPVIRPRLGPLVLYDIVFHNIGLAISH